MSLHRMSILLSWFTMEIFSTRLVRINGKEALNLSLHMDLFISSFQGENQF